MRWIKIVLGATFLAAPSSVVAQDLPREVAAAAASGMVDKGEDEDEDEGNPRLGLLGLLGLIGLLGQFGREPHIHIDARRPPRQ